MNSSNHKLRFAGLSVLVVDDQSDLRELVASMLRELGVASISTASNGREGLVAAQAASVDLILTDIMMPEMNGIELAEHLRKGQAPLLFAMTGGISRDILHDRAYIRSLFDGWIEKPFSFSDIHGALDAAATLLLGSQEFTSE